MSKETTLPTLEELAKGVAKENGDLKRLLNQDPPKEWIKESDKIEGYIFLPIDKVEFLLKELFKDYKIQITGQGVVFNGVWVTVRIHYLVKGESEWMFHDGIGSLEIDARAAGAVRACFPAAKTAAIKDACDHFGKLFGSDLSRKDAIEIKPDTKKTDRGKNRKKELKDGLESGLIKKVEVMP